MKKIYFDQAATSFPKAPGVIEGMTEFMRNMGTNINRGGYGGAYETASIVYETREQLCRLFDFGPISQLAKNVIFTQNITYALNFIIKGYLRKGDHVLVSSLEHNAVMRPLVQLQKAGILEFDRIPCKGDGELEIDSIEKKIKVNTKMIIMSHASNVCGTIQPLKKVGEITRKHNLKFVVDSAQTAGVLPISMEDMNIDALAFTGHKGLLGPQGIGGFLIRDEMVEGMEALITGGTGSISDSEDTPEFLPDKFEPGTLNLPGIIGLHESLKFIENTGIDTICKRELELTEIFIEGLSRLEGIHLIGKKSLQNRIGVVSLQIDHMDEAEVAFFLDNKYKIMTRVGMHCAPNAHKSLGSFPRGSLRFSFSYGNTKEEIEKSLIALKEITKKLPD